MADEITKISNVENTKSGRALQICTLQKNENDDRGRKQSCTCDALASLKVWTIQCPYMNLLDYAKQTLAQVNIESLEMQHLLPMEKWERLEGLMDASYFLLMDEDPVYKVPIGVLSAHPYFQIKISQHVHTVAESSDLQKKHLLSAITEEMEISPDVLDLCDPELSFYWKGKETVEAAIFVSRPQDGVLDILWMWLAKDAANPQALMLLFATAVQKAVQMYSEEMEILCTCLNESAEEILLYFLPDVKPISMIRNYVVLTRADAMQG